MTEQKPVFVKLDSYKEVLTLLNSMKVKLDKAKETLEEVKKLKKDEETEINLWENSINEVEKKIMFVDDALGEPSKVK